MNIIKTVGLTKKFGEFTANNNINLNVKKGEIKAIIGENGAGKSTLMNMLYGLLKPTSGQIFINDQQVELSSPTDAINVGIGMVHQHFKLVPSLTVYENIYLGIERQKHITIKGKEIKVPFIDHNEERKKVEDLISKTQFDIKANQKVSSLSIGAKQKVEILKMLFRDVDILIFDEPTAVLTPQEIDDFFDSIREMKKEGKTIIIISHKLNEVMSISDSVSVLQKGQIIAEVKTSETSKEELAQLMVGRDVLLTAEKEPKDIATEELYRVENLSTKNEHNQVVVDGVSLTLHKGEIVGVAGVEGNGQSELTALLTGMMCSISGDVYLENQKITNKWPSDLRKAKIGMIPEDRYIHGLCTDMSIKDNIVAGNFTDKSICKNGVLNKNAMRDRRDKAIEKYDIRVSDAKGKVSSLSGGNAQKIIIARELERKPKVLICAQPTRGVDIGAIEFIHKSIINYANEGNGVLLVSSELSEIMSLSDRIVVMYKGKIIGELNTKDTTVEEVGLLMAGIKKNINPIENGLLGEQNDELRP